jgi:hypothetical protein
MIRAFLVFAMMSVAAPAWPCTAIMLASAERLVADAEVIARVRAEGLSSTPGRVDSVLAASPTQVRFAILELLKGDLSSSTIEFNGSLTNGDDRNDRPVPYDFIRPGGRGGNCFALTYRTGAEYLLLLRRDTRPSDAEPNQLTPYWAALRPTNEQLFDGAADAWFVWVSKEVKRR